MNFVVYDTERKFNDEFLSFLKSKMIQAGLAKYNPKKTIMQEVYINDFYKSKFRKYISAREVIVSGLYNIVWHRYIDKIVFEIDPNQLIAGTDAKLYEVCKLINYGTLDMRAYPIFTVIFSDFKNHIDRWYDYYGNGGI